MQTGRGEVTTSTSLAGAILCGMAGPAMATCVPGDVLLRGERVAQPPSLQALCEMQVKNKNPALIGSSAPADKEKLEALARL
jgi:hypothetical protein